MWGSTGSWLLRVWKVMGGKAGEWDREGKVDQPRLKGGLDLTISVPMASDHLNLWVYNMNKLSYGPTPLYNLNFVRISGNLRVGRLLASGKMQAFGERYKSRRNVLLDMLLWISEASLLQILCRTEWHYSPLLHLLIITKTFCALAQAAVILNIKSKVGSPRLS